MQVGIEPEDDRSIFDLSEEQEDPGSFEHNQVLLGKRALWERSGFTNPNKNLNFEDIDTENMRKKPKRLSTNMIQFEDKPVTATQLKKEARRAYIIKIKALEHDQGPNDDHEAAPQDEQK